jgi:hypothetical protein
MFKTKVLFLSKKGLLSCKNPVRDKRPLNVFPKMLRNNDYGETLRTT